MQSPELRSAVVRALFERSMPVLYLRGRSGASGEAFPRGPWEREEERLGTLLESPTLDRPITKYTGPKHPEVEKPSWSEDTVWLDKKQTAGFQGVPETVWNFHIGGYQVCNKWLKDRKGRTLSDEDLTHYQKIVVALNETIRLMAEIDEVIEAHGGWPNAFQGTSDK